MEEEVSKYDNTFDAESSMASESHNDLKGLFMLLSSSQFVNYLNKDIQLRVGVCICKMLKLFCPHNPFSGMLEEKKLTKVSFI